MLLTPDGPHLTYCTNIHAADGWDAVLANLRRIAPELKSRLAPSQPFGLGLRLSAREARELLQPGHLDQFRSFLDAEGLYVAIINGFPYGQFHGTPVKAEVYAPDWRNDARVRYTLDLVEILSRLLPASPGPADGGVSTAPLSYKAWMQADDETGWETITRNLARVAEALVRMREERGVVIHLDIEPEPDCLLETTSETIEFFERRLLADGAPILAAALGVSSLQALGFLLDHVRICFDCCHVSVEHEDPEAALEQYGRGGIQIGRVQLSSALDVDVPADSHEASRVAARLRPFADPVYLHQVVEQQGDARRQFPDLDDALRDVHAGADRNWRIHFHVPLFTSEYDGLRSTQRDVSTIIRTARATPFTNHLEIETYTWDVLPGDLKIDVVNSIVREYEWVLGQWEQHS